MHKQRNFGLLQAANVHCTLSVFCPGVWRSRFAPLPASCSARGGCHIAAGSWCRFLTLTSSMMFQSQSQGSTGLGAGIIVSTSSFTLTLLKTATVTGFRGLREAFIVTCRCCCCCCCCSTKSGGFHGQRDSRNLNPPIHAIWLD